MHTIHEISGTALILPLVKTVSEIITVTEGYKGWCYRFSTLVMNYSKSTIFTILFKFFFYAILRNFYFLQI